MSKSKLDVPVGTVVSYRKKQLRVEELHSCDGCYFNTRATCGKIPCFAGERSDKTSVQFKLVTNEQV